MEQRLSDEVRFITTRLGEIVREQAGDETFEQIERIRRLSKGIREGGGTSDLEAMQALIGGLPPGRAYEIAHAFSLFFQLVNVCEERERLRKLRETDEAAQSLRRLFRELDEAGVTDETLQVCLDDLEIEPVLTAHPTEAKRRSVIYQLWRIREDFEHPDEVLETLWQTEEIHERKLTPLDEVDNTLSFFDRAIFECAAAFYGSFDAELAHRYPSVERRRRFLTFASWVGGDRDGHPHVTPAISGETMARHRACALAHYGREIDRLIAELSHRARHAKRLGAAAKPDELHEPSELFRGLLSGTAARLADESIEADELLRDLRRVQDGLRDQNAWRTAAGRIEALITQVETFGFHLAELDFRDNSDKLATARDEVREELRALRGIQRRHGVAAAHRFVLSMTHDAGNVLDVLRLAKRSRVEALDVVPLFETIGDLEAAPAILAGLCEDRTYRAHLERRGNVQEVMLGYSDSNKDGGYVAANWFLHEAQTRLVEQARAFGVELRFFHGKGGSIDRGGGQSHRSLRAQPLAAPGGRLRITEQGEVVSLKYSSPEIAWRNLEQLTSAVIAARCLPSPDEAYPDRLPDWEAAMRRLARDSLARYQALVHETPGFADYFWQATPIDVIEGLRIGSRPSRRERARDPRSLRAIPWVFAWTQSRHLISSWYGLGYALEKHAAEHPGGADVLREMYAHWPFFRTVLDNAQQSLAKADMHIASRYAALVADESLRERVFGDIRDEHARSVAAVLDVSGESELLANDPVLAESIRLRNPYVDPLNYLQVRFLPEWRRAGAGRAGRDLRRLLALTVGGIAFGMKSTG